MDKNKEIAIRQVKFDGDPIQVIEQDGNHYVAMRPICTALSLNWKNQYRNLKEDPVLNSVMVITTTTGSDGKQYEMVCLPIEYLNGWLFKIPVSRYQGERREKLIRYQKECYRVLYNHFFQAGKQPDQGMDHLALKTRLALQAGLNPYARFVLEEDFGVAPRWDIDDRERYIATDRGLMCVKPRPTAWKKYRGIQGADLPVAPDGRRRE